MPESARVDMTVKNPNLFPININPIINNTAFTISKSGPVSSGKSFARISASPVAPPRERLIGNRKK